MVLSVIARLAVNASTNASAVGRAVASNGQPMAASAHGSECEASLLQLLFGPAAPCGGDKLHVLVLFSGLCGTLVMMLCAFAFFREDKEEQITPLCPQLVVKDSDLVFKMPFDSKVDQMQVSNIKNELIGKVVLDWPDLFRPGGSCGVAGTARLQNTNDCTLATVVARSVSGPGIALCRAGCEIFGFVEKEDPTRYNVRHRTGVHLLTLLGNFDEVDIEGINPVGSTVCWFKKVGTECRGRVLQHVDAGLVICSLMAVHLHRRLQPENPARSLQAGETAVPSTAPRTSGKTKPSPPPAPQRAEPADSSERTQSEAPAATAAEASADEAAEQTTA